MNILDACNLRRVVLKKKKSDVALVTEEPSRVLVVIVPKHEGSLVVPLEVAPPTVSKHSRASKARASSSAPHSITFEGVLDNQVLGSEICIFDNREVTKDIFMNFIYPIDMD